MTLSDLFADALRLLGVLREGQPCSAEQGQDALGVFNNLITSWRESGIELPIEPQSTTTSTPALNEGDRLTLTNLMAVHLSPYYPGRALNPVIVTIATNGYDRWLRNAINMELQPKQMRTVSPGARYLRANILLDTPL